MEKMNAFARTHVLTRPDLGLQNNFPQEIWAAMGNAGLLDTMALSNDLESPCRSIARAGKVLVETGGNFGIALSWMIHHLVGTILLKFRDSKVSPQFNQLLSEMKTGEATVCMAVSEPKAGAHPKFMTARAEKQNKDYLITGEKVYLTNGPIANAFVVISVTKESNGRKEFSAFLVDKNTPGLVVADPMEIPFFKPAPHGRIRLGHCAVPAHALLGQEGRAFTDIVLPFRQMEDAVMTGPVTGAMAFVLARVGADLDSLTPEMAEALGSLKVMTDTATHLSDQVSAMADREDPLRISLLLYFRQMTALWLETLDTFVADQNICLDDPAAILVMDLKSSARLGETIAKIQRRKLGHGFVTLVSV